MPKILTDFPKILCPFIRQTFEVNKEHFKRLGGAFELREPESVSCCQQDQSRIRMGF